MRNALLYVQIGTFIGAGVLFFRDGGITNIRLGAAQVMLAAVQAVIYL